MAKRALDPIQKLVAAAREAFHEPADSREIETVTYVETAEAPIEAKRGEPEEDGLRKLLDASVTEPHTLGDLGFEVAETGFASLPDSPITPTRRPGRCRPNRKRPPKTP